MPRPRHTPLRRCVVCRSSRPQSELIRFYLTDAGHYQLDQSGKAGGRGAWVCREQTTCHAPKQLRRFFRHDAQAVAQQLAALSNSETPSTVPPTPAMTTHRPA
jgi:predicted RNA-binding protein YlxR (DUF448 family)